jgi:AcrR family transcriptional regulator
MDDIADELGATKGRVYHYYRSKADLLIGILTRGSTELIDAVRPIASSDASATQRLAEMSRIHALTMMINNDYQRVAFRSLNEQLFDGRGPRKFGWDQVVALRDEYEALFLSMVDQGARAGEFRTDDPALTVRSLLGSLNWIPVWYRPGAPSASPREANQIAIEVASFVVAGARREAQMAIAWGQGIPSEGSPPSTGSTLSV